MTKRKWLQCVILFATSSFWCCHITLLANDSVSIRARHHSEHAFSRIPEFFRGKEYSGDQLIVRSSSAREGLYFTIPLGKKNCSLRNAKSVELKIIDSTNPQPRVLDYSISEVLPQKRILLVGVTGQDWNQSAMKLVAWKVEIFDSSKEPLFSSQSALWGHSK